MRRKWSVRFDRGMHLIRWYSKAGNKSTVGLSYFFWTPWGTLEISGMERSYYS